MKTKKEITEAFQYAIANGFSVFIKKGLYSSYSSSLVICKKDEESSSEWKDLEEIKNPESLQYKLSSLKISDYDAPKDNDFKYNLFVSLYNQAKQPEDKKELIKDIYSYMGYSWKEDARIKIYRFFKEVTIDGLGLVNLISSIPISVLEANNVDFQKIEDLFKERNAPKKEVDKFWFKFFKTRKNQIKYPSVGPKVAQFLINKYGHNEEVLKPYFAFSNHVRSQFEEINFDLIEEGSKFVISFKINCKKASQMLCIPDHGEHKIANDISNFLYSLREINNWEKVKVSNEDKKDIYEYTVYSCNEVSRDDTIKMIKELLDFKKTNPDFFPNRVSVESWLLNRNLRDELPNQEVKSVQSKKMKI